MKRQDSLRISWVLVAFVAVCVVSDKEAIADYVFGKAVNLGPVVNSQYPDAWWGGSISADALSLYFDSQRPGGYGGDDLWVTTRSTVSDPWGPPVNLGATVNSTASDGCPSISADGLELYFNSMRPGGSGGSHGGDLWVTTRTTFSSPWGKPVWLGPILNTQDDDVTPSISADRLSLFFGSGRPSTTGGIWNIWMSTRPTKQSAWGTPVNLGIAGSEFNPCISADGRLLFFTRGDPGPAPLTDIWVTTRTGTSDKWSEPIDLGPSVNSPPADWPTGVSADGSVLYFASTRPGGFGADDLWQASITPIVDFNGDGLVDTADVCIMIDHWGENYPLCDIGPMPWGDGIVDVQDLIVLSEYLSIGRRAFVDDDAPNDPGPRSPLVSDPLEDGSAEHPFDSIQEAIDAAPDMYYCVVILPGTYTAEGNYDIKFKGKAITVRSIDPSDSATVAATVIDCQGTQAAQHRGFVFDKDESAHSVLTGLTISNAYAAYGSGILCNNNSSPTISKCVLRGNRATQRGGGMYNVSGSPVVTNCIFSGNTAADGGALYNLSNASVVNCTFVNNMATSGSKIHNQGGNLTLTNCILWNNTPPEVRVGAGTVSVTYSDIRGGFTGEGNINVDPLFADPANGDYHLKSQAGRWDPVSQSWVIDGISSPCIDAGDPSSPVGDEPEPNGGRINMGAYGGTTEASKSP